MIQTTDFRTPQARRPAATPNPRLKTPDPKLKLRSADAQRVLQSLIRAGAKAVNRNGEAFNAEFSHGVVFSVTAFGSSPEATAPNCVSISTIGR